jgi:Zn-dependent peptidase ImmA (M78 family)
MERIRIGGRVYADPDVVALIRTGAQPVDPQCEVVKKARELNKQLRNLGEVVEPRRRLEMLASLAGLRVSPMSGPGLGTGVREALVYRESNGSRRIYYDPTFPDGRINFSIAHEIAHTFFPSSMTGARFRSMCADDSREANELEFLCHRGAAELLMPVDEFAEELADGIGLAAVPRLCQRFGGSFEATVYRLATASDKIAIAGSLQFRYRKDEARQLAAQRQPFLFDGFSHGEVPAPKYRRQSLHVSDGCGPQHIIPWNKSFDEGSCVYEAAVKPGIQFGREQLPNRRADSGMIEAVQAPYQRSGTENPDILFIWWR